VKSVFSWLKDDANEKDADQKQSYKEKKIGRKTGKMLVVVWHTRWKNKTLFSEFLQFIIVVLVGRAMPQC
jgi:hypothetical protein